MPNTYRFYLFMFANLVENCVVLVDYILVQNNRVASLTNVTADKVFITRREMLGAVTLTVDKHGLEGVC